jgi:prephenate dehydrogenase
VDVAVIGLGLIGGSLLRALAAAGHRVTGFDADPATRELAATDGFDVRSTLREAIAGADLAVLAVPLPALPGALATLTGSGAPAAPDTLTGAGAPAGFDAPAGSDDQAGSDGRAMLDRRSDLGDLAVFEGIVTDVTSVKGPVRELAAQHGLRRFVGGHPMAGKETSGFAAADAGLFEGCAWVLCLEPHDTDVDDWLTLAALFTSMGARVVPVTAAEHDRAVAEISHVPHLLASALSLVLVENPLAATLAAGSFRDGTRVAATRAELIAAMCGGNAAAVRDVLSSVIGELRVMLDKLDTSDPIKSLTPELAVAGAARRAWPPPPGVAGEAPARIAELLALGRAGGWVTAVAEDRATVRTMRPETGRNPA